MYLPQECKVASHHTQEAIATPVPNTANSCNCSMDTLGRASCLQWDESEPSLRLVSLHLVGKD